MAPWQRRRLGQPPLGATMGMLRPRGPRRHVTGCSPPESVHRRRPEDQPAGLMPARAMAASMPSSTTVSPAAKAGRAFSSRYVVACPDCGFRGTVGEAGHRSRSRPTIGNRSAKPGATSSSRADRAYHHSSSDTPVAAGACRDSATVLAAPRTKSVSSETTPRSRPAQPGRAQDAHHRLHHHELVGPQHRPDLRDLQHRRMST